jgi:hypothetical protein
VHGIKDTAQLVTKPELKAVEDKIGKGGEGGGLTEKQVEDIVTKRLDAFPGAYADILTTSSWIRRSGVSWSRRSR